MKNLLIITTACIISLATSQQADATLILDLPATHIPGSSNPKSIDIATVLGIDEGDLGSLLYLIDRSSLAVEGLLQGSYSGSYDPATGDGIATITWVGPEVANATYLLAKDGTEGSYVWDISGWNGKETIIVADGVFAQHAFSHVEFFGSKRVTPDPHGIPDGGTTAAMLGLGLLGLRFMVRRKD